MDLQPITEGLPVDIREQLLPEEEVYYFSYITSGGGCGKSKPRLNYWIAISDKRVLYKAKVQDNTNRKTYIERDGILPLSKVSFVEVAEKSESSGCGCSRTKVFSLQVGTSGGTVIIPMPTKDKGYEVRRVYSEIAREKEGADIDK